jgi:quercetin dioxygenase-like cupin family protein
LGWKRTITVTGDETNGRFCVIDMHVPPGGGPGPHRHDFEETFILLEGEVEVTLRGKKSIVKAGDSINIRSNAPHQFHNSSSSAARLLCICSPAGSENFFMELGVKVATRTTPPPKLSPDEQAAFMKTKYPSRWESWTGARTVNRSFSAHESKYYKSEPDDCGLVALAVISLRVARRACLSLSVLRFRRCLAQAGRCAKPSRAPDSAASHFRKIADREK